MRLLACTIMALGFVVCRNVAATAGDFSDAADAIATKLTAHVDCHGGQPVKVGIWPFDESEIPIGAANAYRLYSSFLADLLQVAPSCAEFFDGDGVGATTAYLNKVGAFRDAGSKPLDVIEANLKNVEYYVAATLVEQASQIYAVFKLVDAKSGSTLAASEPLQVPANYVDESCGDGAMTINSALTRIAARIRDGAPTMSDLVVEGGFFENTNAKTEFSVYLEGLLSGEIAKAFENTITGRELAVHRSGDNQSQALLKVRGLSVTPVDLDPRNYEVPDRSNGQSESTFLLTFRYWLCAQSAKLQVNLASRSGKTVSWIGSIRLDGLPENMALKPPTPTETKDWGPDGAFAFDMTSLRGRNPGFHPGDKFEVLFRLDRDAWLYCFYTDSDGQTIEVLPNPYQHDKTANFYAGGKLQLFPDTKRLPAPDPFELTINAKTQGIEVFRCFATSRDVTGDLPAALRGVSLDPISVSYASRLKELFQSIAGVSLSSSKMTVTVME